MIHIVFHLQGEMLIQANKHANIRMASESDSVPD
jgi:hypothetical protein